MVKKSSTILILVITFTCNYVNIKCCPNMINVLLLRTESILPTPPEGRFSKNHLIKTWLSDLETKAKRWFYQQLVEGVPHLRRAEDQDGEAVPENPKNPNNHLRRKKCYFIARVIAKLWEWEFDCLIHKCFGLTPILS